MKKILLALLLWAFIPLTGYALGTGFHDLRLDLGDVYDTNDVKKMDITDGIKLFDDAGTEVVDIDDNDFTIVGTWRQGQGNGASDLAMSTSTSLTPSNLDASFITLTSTGGAVLVGSLPTIATTTAVAGDRYTLLSTTVSVTFSDNDSVAGTLLELGSTSRALGVGDILELIYHNSSWWEIGFYNN